MSSAWLHSIRRYLALVLAGDLLWEMAHLPLYTIWRTGTVGELVVAVLHCTAGDVVIATASLVSVLVVAGPGEWPHRGYARVAVLAISIGFAYTIYSERVNVVVKRSWAYSDMMPVLPWIEVGLSPLLQWLVVPAIAFYWTGGSHRR